MMTDEEVDAYLESIGGLINDYFPDREPITQRFFECNSGWNEMIVNLIKELIEAGWDKHICQVKEKFGGLRFYIGDSTKEINNIIYDYEHLSYKTCESCGKNDDSVKLRKGGWIVTLCEDCNGERGK